MRHTFAFTFQSIYQVWPLRVAVGSCLHVWLPGMERPEALFASVMQLESRLRGVQLADIVLQLRVSCDDEQTPPLRVTGLWLQGADYNRERWETKWEIFQKFDTKQMRLCDKQLQCLSSTPIGIGKILLGISISGGCGNLFLAEWHKSLVLKITNIYFFIASGYLKLHMLAEFCLWKKLLMCNFMNCMQSAF